MDNFSPKIRLAYQQDPNSKRFSIERWVKFGFARHVAPELYDEHAHHHHSHDEHYRRGSQSSSDSDDSYYDNYDVKDIEEKMPDLLLFSSLSTKPRKMPPLISMPLEDTASMPMTEEREIPPLVPLSNVSRARLNKLPALEPIEKHVVSQKTNVSNFLTLFDEYCSRCNPSVKRGCTMLAPTNIALTDPITATIRNGNDEELKRILEFYLSENHPSMDKSDGSCCFVMKNESQVLIKTDRSIHGYTGSILETSVHPSGDNHVIMCHDNIFH